MTNQHGDFIWYELITPDPDAAERFYGPMLGWTFKKSDQAGIDYRLFSTDEAQVGGLMKTPGGAPMPPAWLGYVGVDNVDKMVASIRDVGGSVHYGPDDIPNVGRFAFVADPQGASFYIMRGSSDEPSLSFSYDKPRPGHCAWNELSSSDPAAALHFYGQRFGWVKDGELDMGDMGKYQFLRHHAGMLGAVMPRMPQMPVSAWTYYFRVPDIDGAVAHIEANGGTVIQAPTQIPGGDYSMNAIDPQGAHFALVGARNG